MALPPKAWPPHSGESSAIRSALLRPCQFHRKQHGRVSSAKGIRLPPVLPSPSFLFSAHHAPVPLLTSYFSLCSPNRRHCVFSSLKEQDYPRPFLLPRLVRMGSKLVGCGSAVPKTTISNDDLAQFVDTSDEWISVRTGIRSRRVLTGNETLNGLALEATNRALQMAGIAAADVDLVIMCTSTPDDLFGGGGLIQRDLGCKNAWAFDITAACSGFLVGLITATRFIKGGGYQNILVIGADALSRYVDWTDRGICILFGDAAGAVLVQSCDANDDGLLGFDIHSDGHGHRHLNAVAVDSETQVISSSNGAFIPRKASYSCIQMNGNEVFRFAVRCVPQSIENALQEAGLSCSNVDWLLLHQANQRILDAVATRLQIPSEKIISNLANYGNTSAASIPLALDEAVRAGKVKVGDMIAASGFGAGLTWGSAIVRWG